MAGLCEGGNEPPGSLKAKILVPPQDEDSPDPILSAGLFEGDIAGVNLSDFSPFEKNAIRDLNKRWPGGIIPYVISNSFIVRHAPLTWQWRTVRDSTLWITGGVRDKQTQT
ncbi:hypothetical protein ANN_11594 [Periplaneta americana]|uniref:Per a allergen n=1 Tax=Periplaneta americana TaxID=6978 RepID=A0ABQ8T6W7_PERAM|nr:hypothetical protein ANN_11594 [Periplaneta americana]